MYFKKFLTFVFILCRVSTLIAQRQFPQLRITDNSDKTINHIRQNKSINADSAYKILNNWSQYPALANTGQEYIYYYTDPFFGEIPLRVYIPANYKSTQKSPCVLMLHGATGIALFKDIDSLSKFDPDILFSTLKTQNFILVRPVADREKKFNWSVNLVSGRNGTLPNPTFATLTNILISLKKVLNIDDNRVFAFGHSDGSDGAVGLAVYSPDSFAGFVVYNSMLNNIFGWDFYIRNLKNRPAYIVHSDLDDLRPIQETRVVIDALTKTENLILYKEYIGYKHEDKHIDKDVRYSVEFMNSIYRNPHKSSVFWETAQCKEYNSCDWLSITGIDTALNCAPWYAPFNFGAYDKKNKIWQNRFLKYYRLGKSAAVKATYNNNVFNVETSRVTEIELLISPVMVNLENPVIVNVNGKQVFAGKVLSDKSFLLKKFNDSFDRQALWVNSIKVKITP